MIRKSKILSDTLMVRSDVVTSEFACRTGWGCIAIWVQLKNSTVYKSTEYEVQNTRFNDGQFAEEYGFGSRHTVVI